MRTLSGPVLCGAHLQSWALDLGVGLNPDGHGISWLMVQEWHIVRVRSTVELEQKFWKKKKRNVSFINVYTV